MTRSPIVVALDFADGESALRLANRLSPDACRLKVGKELFTLAGPDLVRRLVDKNFDVFLDLKFHDIPNTVAAAVQAAAKLGVWMVNVHASGGERMMQAARDALAGLGDKAPLLIAVTVLTSMTREELNQLHISGEVADHVLHLATLTKRCGLDGVVCSASEARLLKQHFGKDFALVTPGIRPAGSAQGDQRRVMTPRDAIAAGSDYLVIGRPITQASDPLAALIVINKELGIS
jgi:orotidine-5'-phosphate decarboxylase